MNWKRLACVIGLVVTASAGAFTYLMRQERARLRAAKAVPPVLRVAPAREPNHAWRWPTESEWVVHEVVRRVVSWELLSGSPVPEGAPLRVHRDEAAGQPGTFEVEIVPSSARLSVRPAAHVWDPEAYVDVARTLNGADGTVAPGEPVARVSDLLLAADSASLRKADAVLFREMSRRPRDPRLHEQAALLWAAHALRETDGDHADERPFLNAITAHLALARSARGVGTMSHDGEIAAVVLDALLLRQVEAMEALQRIEAAFASADARAWSLAIRLRITHDPRLIPTGTALTRLEKLEGMRALSLSEGCRRAVEQARSWHLAPAADWVRAIVTGCGEPEFSQLARSHLDLQVRDAARLLDMEPAPLEPMLRELGSASSANTHQPARPLSIVSRHLRADTGSRHILSGLTLIVRDLKRLGLPEEVKAMSAATQAMRENLAQRALLELSLASASEEGVAARVCERLARLVIDRPDLVTRGWWRMADSCQSQASLRLPGGGSYLTASLTPGTALQGTGPWQAGLALKANLAEATRRAPWDASLIDHALIVTHEGDVPPAAVRQAYEKLLDYDVHAMIRVASGLRDTADDEVQHLAGRICDIDVEQCAAQADYLASLGRDSAAESLWKRALAGARDQIGLSANLGRYVGLLLDQGDSEEALRVARRAADVYSGGGLFTLAFALERLGRFDEAAGEYAKITRRYGSRFWENAFFVRYRQRHGGDRFVKEAELATAELFPQGLRRRTLEGFRRVGHRGGVMQGLLNMREPLRRAGIRLGDIVLGIDGFVVENEDQMSAVLTFTDDPNLSAIVLRSPSRPLSSDRPQSRRFEPTEISGQYHRWRYGLVTRPASSSDR